MLKRVFRRLLPALLVGAMVGPIAGVEVASAAGAATTTTSLQASPPSATVTYGTEAGTGHLNLIATVTDTSSKATTPTGPVTIDYGGSTVCQTPSLTGTATSVSNNCSLTSDTVLPVGTDALTAEYGGDSAHAGSTSTPLDVTVDAPSATVTVKASQPSVTYGHESDVNFSTDVTAAPATAGTPTGSVAFFDAATGKQLCAPATLVDGMATCDSPFGAHQLGAGTYDVYAVYQGSGAGFGTVTATSKNARLTVDAATAYDSLSLSPPPVTYGQEAGEVVTVTVTSNTGAPAPTGYVQLSDGAWSCNAGPLASADPSTDASSTASCTIQSDTALPAGKSTITATWAGDATYLAGASTTATIKVDPAATTTALTVTGSPAAFGSEDAVSYAVTVTGKSGLGAPDGKVTVEELNSGTTVCTGTLTNQSGDTASVTCHSRPMTLAVGTYSRIAAVYAGQGNYAKSSSAVASPAVAIESVGSMASLAWGPAKDLTYGAETKGEFTATIAGNAVVGPPSGGVGAVTLQAKGNGNTYTLCKMTALSGSGPSSSTAECGPSSDTVLPAGTYSVDAAYSGDSHYAATTSTVTGLTVDPASTSTTMQVGPTGTTSYRAEQHVIFTATVTNTSANSTGPGQTPAGTVSFYDGLNLVCQTKSLSGAGKTATAACSPSASYFDVGTYTAQDLTAVYNPGANSNFTGSASASTGSTVLLTVEPAPTTTKVNPSPDTVQFGEESGVTYWVGVASAAGGVPSGTVTVTTQDGANTVTLCTAALDASGEGKCSPAPSQDAALPVANSPYTITATYSGAPNYGIGTAGTNTLTVTPGSTTTSLALNTDSVQFGQETNVAFTATVTDTLGTTLPDGSVHVKGEWSTPSGLQSVTLCSTHHLTPVGIGKVQAECSVNYAIDLPGGSYSSAQLYAVYKPGSPDFAGSTSKAAGGTILTVRALPTTLSVTPMSSTVAYGNESSVTFFAHVDTAVTLLGPNWGVVTIKATNGAGKTTTLCTVDGKPFSGNLDLGQGNCSVPSDTLLDMGEYTISASYQDLSYGPDFGSSTTTVSPTLTVTAAATSTQLVVSPATITFGNENVETLRANVTDTTDGVAPTGTVTFYSGSYPGTAICTTGDLQPESPGSSTAYATCSPKPTGIAPGTYVPDTLVAVYGGTVNGDIEPSTSPDTNGKPTLLTVKAATPTVTVDAVPSAITFGNEQDVVFDVQATSGSTPVSGPALVSAGGVTLCTAIVTDGHGACSPKSSSDGVLSVGGSPYTVTANYVGGTGFAPATGTTALAVQKGTTKTALALTSPITVGSEQSETFTMTVWDTSGTAVPTGRVTLKANATVLCSPTLVDGQATCTLTGSQLAAGSYSVTAVYGGDASLGGSAAIKSLTVSSPPTAPSGPVSSFTAPVSFFPVTLSPVTVTLNQTSATSATVATSSSSSFNAQLATVGQAGTVTFAATGSSNQLEVSPSGQITTTGTLAAGTYSIVGTDADTSGDTGVWTFELTVTAPSPSVAAVGTGKKVALVPEIALVSHNLVVRKRSSTSMWTSASLKCSKADCQGVASITQRRSHFVKKGHKKVIVSRIVVLGKVAYQLSAGSKGTAKIHLNAAGRKLLGKASRSHLALRVVLKATVHHGHRAARTVFVV